MRYVGAFLYEKEKQEIQRQRTRTMTWSMLEREGATLRVELRTDKWKRILLKKQLIYKASRFQLQIIFECYLGGDARRIYIYMRKTY